MTELVRDVSRAEVIQAKTIMRGPNVVVYERQGPRAALHAMESHGLDAVFLIARDFTLRGILTREQARAVFGQRKESPEHTAVTPVMTTAPDSYNSYSQREGGTIDEHGDTSASRRHSALGHQGRVVEQAKKRTIPGR